MSLTSLQAIKSSHVLSSTNFQSFTRKAGTVEELESKVCIALGIQNNNIKVIEEINHIM